jgi:thiamine-phosphate pyrophosphorylase
VAPASGRARRYLILTVPSPIICLVTAGHGREHALLDLIAEAAQAGIDLIQIRERGLDDRALLNLTRHAVEATRGTASRIVVNDRVDVALTARASGVHLRGDSFAAGGIRALAPPGFLIGRSVHDPAEAAAVESGGGCDYLLFGTVFPSTSKPPTDPIAGPGALREVCTRVGIPVLAIGGISIENVRQVAACGAAGIAAISLFERGDPIAATVSMLRRRFDT